MSDKFDIPIIIIIYNRFDYLENILSKLRIIQPEKIYIAADGPKDQNDKIKCDFSRNYLETNISWKCNLIKKYNKTNIGLKKNINQSLDWLFLKEKMAIILEDDCNPSLTFFQFCKELLLKYENNKKIKMISGNFYYEKKFTSSESYFFSKRPGTHGWATWKRTWLENDQSMSNWNSFYDFFWLLKFFNLNITKAHYFYKKFQYSYDGKINSWDYQLLLSIWKKNGLIIRPFKHLCKHVGWGSQSTHGKGQDTFPNLVSGDINFPLKHPSKIDCNSILDNYEDDTLRKLNYINYLTHKFKSKIKNILNLSR
jgi:hypothetical protein